jgi:hypothetical protein
VSIRIIYTGIAIAIIITAIFYFTSLSVGEVPLEYVQVKEISLVKSSHKKNELTVKAFQAKTGDSKEQDAPARLCFFKGDSKNCFDAIETVDNTTYYFQFVDVLSAIQLYSNNRLHKALLFVTEYFGGGSGSLKLITFWLYRNDNNSYEKVLPPITVTEQSEYRLLKNKKGNSVFVTADYIWGDKETHFSPHRFKIKIYNFYAAQKAFVIAKEYITKRVYKSLDDVDMINVISPEFGKIKKYIN